MIESATARPPPDEVESVRMTFGEHLDELRRRLIKSLLAWAACFIVAMVFYQDLVRIICQPHMRVMDWLEVTPANRQLMHLAYADGIFAVMKLSFIVATFAASPIILYQLWAFVAAGLYKQERKYVTRYAPFSFLLFAGGCLFGYFVLVPYGLYGMASMLKSDVVSQQFSFANYLGLVMTLTIITGAIFELPLIMMFVTSIGLVPARQWWTWMRYAIVAIFFAAAILTPSADIGTMLLMAVPLFLLYLAGWGLSYLVQPKPAPGAPA